MAMSNGNGSELPIAARIRNAMDLKGWTQEQLAAKAGYDGRTIRNVLTGRGVRRRTLVQICEALEVPVDDEQDEVAAEQYGGYSRRSFEGYIGHYLACRRSFSVPDQLVCSLFNLQWDAELKRISFEEIQRYKSSFNKPVDTRHTGGVYISETTGLVHFVTIFRGAVRLVTLTRARLDRLMRGSVLTQADRKNYYQPSVSPIFLRKLGDDEVSDASSLLGSIASNHRSYGDFDSELLDVERDVAFVARLEPRQPQSG